MISNYFKVAFRKLVRNKSFTIINIVGLTVGMASCLLIYLLIRYELSFDNFHHNAGRIYRIVSEQHRQDGILYSGGIPFPAGKALLLDFPQVKKIGSILKSEGQITVLGNSNYAEKMFKEENVYYAEPRVFDIFNFPCLTGNRKTALSEPNTAILTQSAPNKYFGNWRNAVGKSIRYLNNNDYKITGIIKDIPPNSDFPLQIVLSYASLKNTSYSNNLDDWTTTIGEAQTYIVLPSYLTKAKFNNELRNFVHKHKSTEYVNDKLILQPLNEVHFDNRFGNYNGRTFSRELITALSFIAAFILIIGCVNFINLATAQAVKRSREIGIRKVLGSNRKQIVFQFLSETFLITVFAALSAIVVAELCLPYLNVFLNRSINFDIGENYEITGFFIILTFLVAIISGFYPAIILSGFSPITALKNKLTSKAVGLSLRRGLVIFQFTIAYLLIIGMMVILMQMDYFKNNSLGFDKDAVVLVPIPAGDLSRDKMDLFKQQLLQQTGIKAVSLSTFSPADNSQWLSNFKFDNSINNSGVSADLKWADADYFKTYNIELISGRHYTQNDSANELVVNETFVKKLGFKYPEDIIGKEVNFYDEIKAPIVGVIKDFHPGSLHNTITPVVLGCWKEVYQLLNIKIKSGQIQTTLPGIEKIWAKLYPESLYEYQFLDQKIDDFYKQENQLSQLYKIFAVIAVFISCLGLYGLVTYMVAQKTKEVGMRKVLGASTTNIIYLFSKEFIILICIAYLAASSAAFFIMNNWLQNFAYRINLSWWIFALSGVIGLGFALATVGVQAIKAATANPVKALKYE
jgi:putative ABC transport system permease protein